MAHFVTVWHIVSQYVTLCYSMSQYVTVRHSMSQYVTICNKVAPGGGDEQAEGKKTLNVDFIATSTL
jgi:hypothetical protein